MSKKPAQVASLTTRQVIAGFGVSDMSIWTWRKGNSVRDPLPIVKDGRSVRFPVDGVLAYSKKYRLPFSMSAARAVQAPRPGPKATPVEDKPKVAKVVKTATKPAVKASKALLGASVKAAKPKAPTPKVAAKQAVAAETRPPAPNKTKPMPAAVLTSKTAGSRAARKSI